MTRTSDVVSHLLGAALVADTGEWGTFAWSEHVLGAPGYRIAGGSDEIQRNIIGERVLGLPSEPACRQERRVQRRRTRLTSERVTDVHARIASSATVLSNETASRIDSTPLASSTGCGPLPLWIADATREGRKWAVHAASVRNASTGSSRVTTASMPTTKRHASTPSTGNVYAR